MSKPDPSSSAVRSNDTGFRKTRDASEYAAKAALRDDAERDEKKARYEAKLAGKQYYKPLDGTETQTEARRNVLDLSGRVGKTQLVAAAGAGIGKRGRGAGFYCAECDLTFKDNLQWVEHINSPQHLRAIGQTGEVRAATADEVHARIEALWARDRALERERVTGLEERIKIHAEDEEREREVKRVKRREDGERRRLEREKAAGAKLEYGEDVRVEGEHDEEDMMAAMGITGFGTTAKK